MARVWMFNAKLFLPYYLLTYLELFIATIEESFYWTIQNETNEFCQLSYIIPWGGGEDCLRTTTIGILLIETIYFWMHVYHTRKIQDLYILRRYCIVFIVFLIPSVLPVIGVQINMLSSIGHVMSKVRLAVLLFTQTLSLEKIDKEFDLTSLNEEVGKCLKLEGEDKSKSTQRIIDLQTRVRMNRNREHILNYSTYSLRDTIFAFGFMYFGIALVVEVIWYDNSNIHYSIFLNSVCKLLLRWSTSFVTVLIIFVYICFIERILTGLSLWWVSWETTFAQAINSGTGSRIVYYSIISLILETGIPSSDTDVDVKSVIITAVLLLCFLVQKAVDKVGQEIIDVFTRSSVITVWFYLRVCVAFLIMLTICVVVFAFVICDEVWIVFLASGSVAIISNIIFILTEWCLVSLTWHMDQYAFTIEKCIQYIQIAKEFSYIILLLLQFFALYMLSMFRAWWILRAVHLILTYIIIVVILISQKKKMYYQNKEMLLLVNKLSDVLYAPLHGAGQAGYTCSICFSTIRDGKVLPCRHVFHAQCLQQWFKIRTVCPTCNLKVK